MMYDNTTTVAVLTLIVATCMLPTVVANARDCARRSQVLLFKIMVERTPIGRLVVFCQAAMGPVPADEFS